jgi:hypothetical protein
VAGKESRQRDQRQHSFRIDEQGHPRRLCDLGFRLPLRQHRRAGSSRSQRERRLSEHALFGREGICRRQSGDRARRPARGRPLRRRPPALAPGTRGAGRQVDRFLDQTGKVDRLVGQ